MQPTAKTFCMSLQYGHFSFTVCLRNASTRVRCLRCVDFNFTDNTIYIADGKHHRIGACLLTQMLWTCARVQPNSGKTDSHRTYFFQSQSGKAYTTDWLCDAFRVCWKMSGNGTSRGPCIPMLSDTISPRKYSCAGLRREKIWTR